MLHSLYGTPEDLGVLISITGFAIIVLWGLLGGVVSLLYRSGDGAASLGEIEGMSTPSNGVSRKRNAPPDRFHDRHPPGFGQPRWQAAEHGWQAGSARDSEKDSARRRNSCSPFIH